MKSLKSHIWLILAGLLCLCGCDKEPAAKLVMATNAAFHPYEFVSGNKIDGIDPEIIRRIADNLGYDLVIQDMSFDSVIMSVQRGKADVAASGITVTEERKKQVLFTVPYVVAEQVVLVEKNSPFTNLAEFEKSVFKRGIGVQHGTTGDLYATEHFKNDVHRYQNGAVAVAALKAGKLDAIIIDSDPALVYVSKNPQIRRLPGALTYEEYAFAISKNNPELCEAFNREITRLKESGELAAIIEHYQELTEQTAENLADEEAGIIGKLAKSLEINFLRDNRYHYLVNGFANTLIITVFAVAIGIALGFSVAVVRSTHDQTGRWKLLNFLCRVYLAVIRGTPVVVQLLIIYFVIFGSVNISKLLVAILAFGFNSGAYVAEIVRAGIMSIDRGQLEAATSLGLSYRQGMKKIILPQAFKNVLPALGNEFIVLLKETSVAGYIALQDLTKGGDIIRSQTYDAFLPLIAVAVIYLAVVMLLTKLLSILEKRLKKYE